VLIKEAAPQGLNPDRISAQALLDVITAAYKAPKPVIDRTIATLGRAAKK